MKMSIFSILGLPEALKLAKQKFELFFKQYEDDLFIYLWQNVIKETVKN